MEKKMDYRTIKNTETDELTLEELRQLRDALDSEIDFDKRREDNIQYHSDWDWDQAQEAHNDTKYDEEQLKEIDDVISKRQP